MPQNPSSMPKPGSATFDVEAIRRDFPILQRTMHGKPLVWLDSAATSQKPRAVIDRVTRYYEQENSNIHRGTHTLAEVACDAYDDARDSVAEFLNAGSQDEVVFVRGTTEGINLLAAIFTDSLLKPGDEIVLTEAEHHANIVPWQFAAQKSGAIIRVAPVDDNGDLILEEYERLLGPRTRVVSITHISNALGTVMPIQCKVERIRWPVSAACTAICAVSRSRISPIIMMSGSWRRKERSALAKVSPICGFTCTWLTPFN